MEMFNFTADVTHWLRRPVPWTRYVMTSVVFTFSK